MRWIWAVFLIGCGNHGTTADDVDAPPAIDASGALALTVVVSGVGHGAVTSDVGGITCTRAGGTCTASESVTLTATPDAGYVFAGWSGAGCHGAGTCKVPFSATVHAVFTTILLGSRRALDGSDAAGPNKAFNLWLVRTDGTGLTPLTHYTAANIVANEAAWSPDGEHVVFASTAALDGSDTLAANDVTNIWTIDADGQHAAPLTHDTDAMIANEVPRWSPDGTRIAYAHGVSNGAGGVWIMGADGASAHVLVAGGTMVGAYDLAWSHDGKKLAFDSNLALDGSTAGRLDHANIWVVNADGTHLVHVTALTASVSSYAPVWSPNDTRLAYYSRRALDGGDSANPTENLWTDNPDGGGLVAVTTGAVVSSGIPQWSPDGTKLAYTANGKLDGTDALGISNVWVTALDGSGRTPIAPHTAVGSSGALWSPDGATLAFYSGRGLDDGNSVHVFNTWLIDADGLHLRALTKTTAVTADSSPMAWGPDGIGL